MDECSWDGCKVHGMDDLKVHGTTGKFMGSWMKSSWDDFILRSRGMNEYILCLAIEIHRTLWSELCAMV